MSTVESVQPALLNAFLLTTKDALMVLEAARRAICPVVTRRLHDSEKNTMVKSGSVFAFDEHATGIKRWTDGNLWSPSRIIGNYLVYRELEKKGDRTPASTATEQALLDVPLVSTFDNPALKPDPFPAQNNTKKTNLNGFDANVGQTGLQRDVERALIGSLTSSYKFKASGLVKKTFSNGSLHLICYYTIEDVVAGRLRSPSSLIELSSLEISSALLNIKNFRLPPLLEYDVEGNPRYIGEEADPSSAPASLEPMVSPTPLHRQLPAPEEVIDYRNTLPSGMPAAEYYPDYDGPAQSLPTHEQPGQWRLAPSSVAYSTEENAHETSASIYPYIPPPPSVVRTSPTLPPRPYTARPAPQARTIYRNSPYSRRGSDTMLMSHGPVANGMHSISPPDPRYSFGHFDPHSNGPIGPSLYTDPAPRHSDAGRGQYPPFDPTTFLASEQAVHDIGHRSGGSFVPSSQASGLAYQDGQPESYRPGLSYGSNFHSSQAHGRSVTHPQSLSYYSDRQQSYATYRPS